MIVSMRVSSSKVCLGSLLLPNACKDGLSAMFISSFHSHEVQVGAGEFLWSCPNVQPRGGIERSCEERILFSMVSKWE